MLACLIMKHVQRHLDAEDLEKYAMGKSSPVESETIEEHLLTCDDCRHRLRESDDFLLALRSASAQLRRNEIIHARREWRIPAWLPVLAAVACLLVVMFAFRLGSPAGPVVAVSLTALRSNGPGTSAPAGRELMLHPDLTGLAEASSYRLEIVDQNGRPVRQATLAHVQNGVRISRLGVGQYFVRVYLPGGELLREYGLQVQ